MATIEQVKALLRSHFENDNEKFKTISLQIAAHEAKMGHTSSARDIRDIVQNPKYSAKNNIIKINNKIDILEEKICDFELRDLVVTESLNAKIKRVIREYEKKELLRKNGLKNRSKFLITGEPGTGKTMTASVIANELGLSLYVIQLDKLITKYMGETSVKLRQVFESINEVNAVYLFDEFDAIGSDRSLDNDVGEMRRILNSFLQYLENDDSYSIIIAATNNPNILDKALFRRFDDVLEYKLPDEEQIINLYKMKLKGITSDNIFTEEVFNKSIGLNHSDIVKVCEDAIKESILEDKEITRDVILKLIKDRKELYLYKEA
ncbi:MAG: AAA family ATPase [Vulcanibacillus sp.]